MFTKEDLKARILSNVEVAPSHFLMELAVSRVFRNARPGQFVMLRPAGRGVPFLGRPLGRTGVGGGALRAGFWTIERRGGRRWDLGMAGVGGGYGDGNALRQESLEDLVAQQATRCTQADASIIRLKEAEL